LTSTFGRASGVSRISGCPFLALWLHQTPVWSGKGKQHPNRPLTAILLSDPLDPVRRRKVQHYLAKHFGFGSPETCFNNPQSRRLDDDQAERGGSLFEEPDLLLAVAFLVILHALVDVLVPPAKHAVHERRELVGHGRDRFRSAELAAEAAVL